MMKQQSKLKQLNKKIMHTYINVVFKSKIIHIIFYVDVIRPHSRQRLNSPRDTPQQNMKQFVQILSN